MRSTTKEAKNNIKNYIINNFNFDDNPEVKKDFSSVAKAIYNDFKSCILYDGWTRIHKTEQDAFLYYCQGLPSILDTCYYYNRSAKDDLQLIFEQTPTEQEKYTESQAGDYLTYLIYREVAKDVKR